MSTGGELGGSMKSAFPIIIGNSRYANRTNIGGANLMGADLYKNLTNYFIQHLTEVRAVRGTL